MFDTVVTGDTASDLIDEITRLTERLRQSRATASAAHSRLVEQLVEITTRQLRRGGAGDARDALRESALESALERMEAQSRSEQARLLATMRDLDQRLAVLR